MNTLTLRLSATFILLSGLALAGCDENPVAGEGSRGADVPVVSAASERSFAVSGNGVYYGPDAIVHSQEPTESGIIQRSTDIVELSGDLEGYVVFHVTSVIDSENGTLVNTGAQTFSGTVAGSDPVILHDDSFRFEVDLNSGATTGEVHLGRSRDAPAQGGWYECDLTIIGTGVSPEGNTLSEYTGECASRGNVN